MNTPLSKPLQFLAFLGFVGGAYAYYHYLKPDDIWMVALGGYSVLVCLHFAVRWHNELQKIREGFPNHYYSGPEEQSRDKSMSMVGRVGFTALMAGIESLLTTFICSLYAGGAMLAWVVLSAIFGK